MGVLKEIGSCLGEEYENVIMEFEATVEEDVEKENGKKKQSKKKKVMKKNMNVTIVKDSKEFAKKVIEARGLDEEKVKIRVVVDSGQGSLKIAANVFDSYIDPEVTIGDQEGPEERLTGVNRLLILAEVEGGQERHHNIWQLLEKLDIQNLPGLVLVGDLSITNIYLGISKHSGKFACYVCEGPCGVESGTLRTFGSLTSHYESYKAAGSNPKTMQTYKNVFNE